MIWLVVYNLSAETFLFKSVALVLLHSLNKKPLNFSSRWISVPAVLATREHSLLPALFVRLLWGCLVLTVRDLLRLTRGPGPEMRKQRETLPGRPAAAAGDCRKSLLGNVYVTGVTRAKQKHKTAAGDTFLAGVGLRTQPQTHFTPPRLLVLSTLCVFSHTQMLI